MTVDAVVLSWKRTFNLDAIVKSLREQRIVRDIYIWHNLPSRTEVEGAVNVYNDRNFDTLVRHVFALSLDSDYVLFSVFCSPS